MADADSPTMLPRSRTTYWLIALLILCAIGIFAACKTYGFERSIPEFHVMSLMLAALALMATAGLWLQKPGALWVTLVAVSFAATLDLFLWSMNILRTWIALNVVVLCVIAVLAFRLAPPLGRNVSVYQRVLYACVLCFAAWVAFWGLFRPASVLRALPFTVPPLHARFLGSMYLSGAVFMVLALVAREWYRVRVVTLMLAVWTGMLGIISLFHLNAFAWSRDQTWFWFFAYICFPLVALWIVWCQRSQNDHPAGPHLSPGLRGYLYVQGAAAVLVALALLCAPQFMATVWPWKIPLVLAHLYGAPFLSFGIGSIYAARQQAWSEVRIVTFSTLVFAVSVLVASKLHIKLFDLHSSSAWIWFGGFGFVSVALLLFSVVPSLRNASQAE